MGYHPILLESTHKVNQQQPNMIMEMIEKNIKKINDKTISILGLSFKKNTDDTREAVSVKIVKLLLEKKANIKVHDPMATKNFKQIFVDKIAYCDDVVECIRESDCCVILTDWDEYGKLTADDFKKHMRNSCVIDARRMLDPSKMSSIQFSAIGYGNSKSE